MGATSNPTAMSDWDWLQFYSFYRRVQAEGDFDYVATTPPVFQDPALVEEAATVDGLRIIYDKNAGLVDTWIQDVGWATAGDLYVAHLRQVKEAAEVDLLWAVHPGGTWAHGQYLVAFASRGQAEAYLIGENQKAAEQPQRFARLPWRLLNRDTPGGTWVEVTG